MPFAPVFGSKLIIGGEERQYDVAPPPQPIEQIVHQRKLNITVVGQHKLKTIREHMGIQKASTPRDEVVQAKKPMSTSRKKTSQYKMDMLTSEKS